MAFLTGRVTCTRFRVSGRPPRTFDDETLQRLADNAIGKQRVMAGDGSQTGWIAGDHILDTSFDLAKNVVNDALNVSMSMNRRSGRFVESVFPGGIISSWRRTSGRQRPAKTPARIRQGSPRKEEGRPYLRRKSIRCCGTRRRTSCSSAPRRPRRRSARDAVSSRSTANLNCSAPAASVAQAEATNRRAVDDARPPASRLAARSAKPRTPDENNRDFQATVFALALVLAGERIRHDQADRQFRSDRDDRSDSCP